VASSLPPQMDGITVADLPDRYVYRGTHYADLILRDGFPEHYAQLHEVLAEFTIDVTELQAGGGNRTPFVARFDAGLSDYGWGKRNFDIATTIDGEVVAKVRSHEIDMFKEGSDDHTFPGIAVEMEWNNKDPFFDRDLTNFYALHRAGALAVGVIVTRGPHLQRVLKQLVRNSKGAEKYGESSTHWNKLTPRVDLGGGGECPLLLIGIELERITGFDISDLTWMAEELEKADDDLTHWRERGLRYKEVRARRAEFLEKARALLPPTPDANSDLEGVESVPDFDSDG